jgi:acyl-CoA thioester hydrolase
MTEPKIKPEELREYPVVIVLPVLWGDQDSFGHVNNTIPFRWFESARIAYLEQSDLGHLMSTNGIGPILAAIGCNYRRQLHYPDTVHVGARVASIGRTSMVMAHAAYSERLGMIAADGTSTVVMFDYSANKPRRMPEELRAIFERIEGKELPAPPKKPPSNSIV